MVRDVSFLVPWRDLKREAGIPAEVSDRSVPVDGEWFVTSRYGVLQWAQQSATPLAVCFDGSVVDVGGGSKPYEVYSGAVY